MSEKKIYINILEDSVKMALLRDGNLIEYVEKPIIDHDVYGGIYKGKVINVVSGMNAAFVDIGLPNLGYLPFSNTLLEGKTISDMYKVGQEIIVQVSKREIGDKGATLTSDISLTGRLCVLLPYSDKVTISSRIKDTRFEIDRIKDILDNKYGCIIRTASKGVDMDEIEAELKYLVSAWEGKVIPNISKGEVPRLVFSESDSIYKFLMDNLDDDVLEVHINCNETYERIREKMREISFSRLNKIHYYPKDRDMFLYNDIDSQIDKLFGRKVWLKSGGYIILDKTEALTVIDVNSGKHTDKRDKDKTFKKVNEEAAITISRLLRLRDISGIIIVDYITMKSEEDRNSVLKIMKDEISGDPMRPHIYGFTKLGLVEISRKRR